MTVRTLRAVRRRRGFTLIELLVVMAVIALLIGILLPAVQKVRAAAARTTSANNLKQIGLALHNFHAAHNYIPPACGWKGPKYGEGGINGTFFFYLLPFIEQGAIYEKSYGVHPVFEDPYYSWFHEYKGYWACAYSGYPRSTEGTIKMYIHPADPTLPDDGFIYANGAVSYAGNAEVFAFGGKTVNKFASISDGLSNTLFLAEGFHFCSGLSTSPAIGRGFWGALTWNESDSRYWTTEPTEPYVGGPVIPLPDPARVQYNPATLTYELQAIQTFQDRPIGGCDPAVPQSFQPGVLLVGMGDGSVQAVTTGVLPEKWYAAMTPAAGDTFGGDFK